MMAFTHFMPQKPILLLLLHQNRIRILLLHSMRKSIIQNLRSLDLIQSSQPPSLRSTHPLIPHPMLLLLPHPEPPLRLMDLPLEPLPLLVVLPQLLNRRGPLGQLHLVDSFLNMIVLLDIVQNFHLVLKCSSHVLLLCFESVNFVVGLDSG